jgi:dsRNA-specific ribonuclease
MVLTEARQLMMLCCTDSVLKTQWAIGELSRGIGLRWLEEITLKKSGKATTPFRFRKDDHIGSAGAEQDAEFLSKCFIDTGQLKLLEDLSDRRQIVVGRTGCGKSALLWKIEQQNPGRCIRIEPEGLALTYVSNSTVLRFFSDLGVNLDPFFKLFWRHVLTVEILKAHFERAKGEQESASLLEWLFHMFSGTSRKDREMNEAVKYLEDWGKTFWENTEFRVKEITQKVEESLSKEAAAKLGVKIAEIQGKEASSVDFTAEQKSELVVRGQNVISQAQVHDLHRIPKLIDAVLGDRQQRYYIVIDGLDENWVDERLRYRLIMA